MKLRDLFRRKPIDLSVCHPMVGKIVLEVNADGCMAQDHKLMRVGEIVAVKKHSAIWGSKPGDWHDRFDYAVCRVIQSRDDTWGRNDRPDELFYACLQDGGFYRTANETVYRWWK
jgi:hypothetical protein